MSGWMGSYQSYRRGKRMKAFFWAALATVYAAVAEGYSLKLLWQWFIAGPFHIYRLSVPQAVGIAVLVGLLTSNSSMKDEDYTPSRIAYAATVNAVTALVVGGICYMLTW